MALKALIAAIKADGVVDAEEVAQLRTQLMADGVIDREECDALFDLNDAVTGAPNDGEFETLLVDSITSHILADGAVDEEEANYLIAKVCADGKVDRVERKLLENIKAKATSVHPTLSAKLVELGI